MVAHGDSLHALIERLDHISDDDIAELNLPTRVPMSYDLDADMRPAPGHDGSSATPSPPAAAAEAVARRAG